MKRPMGGTSPTTIQNLLDTAQVLDIPPPSTARGRKPLYAPLVDKVIEADGKVVVFGPFEGPLGNSDAERIRSGCATYVKAHPDQIPDGRRVVFSVRRPDDDESYLIRAWLETDAQSLA